jgi:hypothetical protein
MTPEIALLSSHPPRTPPPRSRMYTGVSVITTQTGIFWLVYSSPLVRSKTFLCLHSVLQSVFFMRVWFFWREKKIVLGSGRECHTEGCKMDGKGIIFWKVRSRARVGSSRGTQELACFVVLDTFSDPSAVGTTWVWEAFRRRCKSANHLRSTLRVMIKLSRKWKGGTITRRYKPERWLSDHWKVDNLTIHRRGKVC